MNFIQFSKHFGNNTIIDIRNVVTYFNGLDRRRLYEWQQKGLIIKIVNNFYVMPDQNLDSQALKHIACQVYAPAYVGLASALSWYHFIPEAVFQTTAVTARRNRLIQTSVGDFHYRKIKPDLFFGVSLAGQAKSAFFISDPEKTILDHLYFTPHSDQPEVLDAMRLNIEEIRSKVNSDKLESYASLFALPKINKAVHRLTRMIYA